MKRLRKMSFFTVLTLVIGSVVGTGIYFKIGIVFIRTGNDSMRSLLVWGIGGVITLASALIVAELGSKLKDDGGLASLVGITFGRVGHFFVGWIEIFYLGLLIAAITFYGADALLSVLSLEKTFMNLASVGWGLFLSTAFLSRVRQNASTVISKIAVFLNLIPIFILLLGLFLNTSEVTPLLIPKTDEVALITAIGLALPAVLFAYDGWVFVTTIAEETKNPSKTIPLAIVSGVGIVIVGYLAVNSVTLMTLTSNSVHHLNEIVPYTVAQTFGSMVSKGISFIIFISAYGVLNAYSVLTQYILYGMAEQKNFLMSHLFIKKDQSGIPKVSSYMMLLFIFIFMIFIYFVPVSQNPYMSGMWLAEQASFFSDLPIILIWIAYVLSFLSAGYVRLKRTKKDTGFHLPSIIFWPALLLALIGGIFMLGVNLLSNVSLFFYSSIILFIGGILFYFIKKQSQ